MTNILKYNILKPNPLFSVTLSSSVNVPAFPTGNNTARPVVFADAPHLFFVERLGIVNKSGGTLWGYFLDETSTPYGSDAKSFAHFSVDNNGTKSWQFDMWSRFMRHTTIGFFSDSKRSTGSITIESMNYE